MHTCVIFFPGGLFLLITPSTKRELGKAFCFWWACSGWNFQDNGSLQPPLYSFKNKSFTPVTQTRINSNLLFSFLMIQNWVFNFFCVHVCQIILNLKRVHNNIRFSSHGNWEREVEEKKRGRKASMTTTKLKSEYNSFHFLHMRKHTFLRLPVSRMLSETSVFSHPSQL